MIFLVMVFYYIFSVNMKKLSFILRIEHTFRNIDARGVTLDGVGWLDVFTLRLHRKKYA